MIFYAKDFSILPDSETAKKHDKGISLKGAKNIRIKTIKSSLQKRKITL